MHMWFQFAVQNLSPEAHPRQGLPGGVPSHMHLGTLLQDGRVEGAVPSHMHLGAWRWDLVCLSAGPRGTSERPWVTSAAVPVRFLSGHHGLFPQCDLYVSTVTCCLQVALSEALGRHSALSLE